MPFARPAVRAMPRLHSLRNPARAKSPSWCVARSNRIPCFVHSLLVEVSGPGSSGNPRRCLSSSCAASSEVRFDLTSLLCFTPSQKLQRRQEKVFERNVMSCCISSRRGCMMCQEFLGLSLPMFNGTHGNLKSRSAFQERDGERDGDRERERESGSALQASRQASWLGAGGK